MNELISNPDFLGAIIGGAFGAIFATAITLLVDKYAKEQSAIRNLKIKQKKNKNDYITGYELINKSQEELSNLVLIYNENGMRIKKRILVVKPFSKIDISLFELIDPVIKKTKVPFFLRFNKALVFIDKVCLKISYSSKNLFIKARILKLKMKNLLIFVKLFKIIKKNYKEDLSLTIIRSEYYKKRKDVTLELVKNSNSYFREIILSHKISNLFSENSIHQNYSIEELVHFVLYMFYKTPIEVKYEILYPPQNSLAPFLESKEGFNIRIKKTVLKKSLSSFLKDYWNFTVNNTPIEYYSFEYYKKMLTKSEYKNLKEIKEISQMFKKQKIDFVGEAPIEGYIDKITFTKGKKFKLIKFPQIKKLNPLDDNKSITQEQILFLGNPSFLRKFSILRQYLSNDNKTISPRFLTDSYDDGDSMLINLKTGDFLTTNGTEKIVVGKFSYLDISQILDAVQN